MAGVRIAFTIAAVLAVALLAGSGGIAPAQAAPPTERVWGDDREWEVLFAHETTTHQRGQPFYLIAPIVVAAPQSLGHWGFGPHDQVMNVPPHTRGVGTGPCRVLLVVPGPNGVSGRNIEVVPDPDLGIPLVRAVDLDGDGRFEPLTAAALVETAAATGLVSLFEPRPGGEPIVFLCPVRPSQG